MIPLLHSRLSGSSPEQIPCPPPPPLAQNDWRLTEDIQKILEEPESTDEEDWQEHRQRRRDAGDLSTESDPEPRQLDYDAIRADLDFPVRSSTAGPISFF